MRDDQDPAPGAEPPSKSARKRAGLELQQLAETLLALPPGQLARLPLGPQLSAALEASRAITQREARRRQLQYLGKLMRKADVERIRQGLDQLRLHDRQFRQRLARVDQVCERLLAGGDSAIDALLADPDAPPALTRQQLRQLVRNAARPGAGEPARRKLFDHLRRYLP
ncbi:MAG: ribosome biogenesis factor YjgA [Pseudomonadota bacterium]|jgi:ribosome-associated protein